MGINRVIFFFGTILWGYTTAFGQAVRTPVTTILFGKLGNHYNASTFPDRGQAYVGNQSLIGAFSEIRVFYAHGDIPILKDKKSSLGLTLYSEQEGELIGEYRMKLGFSTRVDLNEKWSLSGGTHIGAINNFLGATYSVGGGSDWSPDLDLGLSLSGKSTKISSSVNQVLNGTSNPLGQELLFERYITFNAEQDFKLNQNFALKWSGGAWLVKTNRSQFNSIVELSYLDRWMIGGGYGTNGTIVTGGVQNIEISNMNLEILMAYQSPSFTKTSVAYRPVQIHLNLTGF